MLTRLTCQKAVLTLADKGVRWGLGKLTLAGEGGGGLGELWEFGELWELGTLETCFLLFSTVFKQFNPLSTLFQCFQLFCIVATIRNC